MLKLKLLFFSFNIPQYSQDELSRKVNEVLNRTPLVLKPIKTPNSLQSGAGGHRNSLVSKAESNPKKLISIASDDQSDSGNSSNKPMPSYASTSHFLTSSNQCTTVSPINTKPDLLNLIDNLMVDQQCHTSDLVTISDNNSTDVLSTPPNLNFDSFLDELLTPDEFTSLNLVNGGLTNINYDFDISDTSAENSVTDDVQKSNSLGLTLDEFDPLLNDSNKCSPVETTNLMDGGDTPNDTLLPSPLKPTVPPYKGFSAFDIPSISCQTGDFGSTSSEAGIKGAQSHKE